MMIRNVIAVAALSVLAGCATTGPGSNHTRAKFVDNAWVAPDLKGRAPSEVYSHVYFAPTRIQLLQKQDWWSQQSARKQSDLAADSRYLARFMHSQLESAAANYPAKKMGVLSQPGSGVLVVETAITEITPSKAYWNAAATAAGFVVPGAGLLGMAGKGVIRFEGRLRDGGTGAVLATFSHRMTDKSAALNLAAYKWYGGAEINIKEFAAKAAEFLNSSSDVVVNRPSQFALTAF